MVAPKKQSLYSESEYILTGYNNFMRFLILFIAVIAILAPQMSWARPAKQEMNDSGYEEVVMPELFDSSTTIDNDEEPPLEPNIGEVKFLKMPPVNGVQGRVDRLVEGITRDVPPEYDHYGYEIRRYMSRVGNTKIFTDEEYLKDQIKNVRKASVIADYWRNFLDKEIAELDEIIDSESESVAFSTRTSFKQNRTTVSTFLISLKSWIDSNEHLLLHVFDNPGEFEVMYPEIMISQNSENIEFYNRSLVKQTKLKEIKAYGPFAMMAY